MPQMKNPECPTNDPAECRVTVSSRVHEPVAWEPEYDGTGRMVNQDPNVYLTVYACSTCGGEWQDMRQGPEVTTEVLRSPRKRG